MQGEGAREDDAALKEGKPSAEEKVCAYPEKEIAM
jgi:hypothetical protein